MTRRLLRRDRGVVVRGEIGAEDEAEVGQGAGEDGDGIVGHGVGLELVDELAGVGVGADRQDREAGGDGRGADPVQPAIEGEGVDGVVDQHGAGLRRLVGDEPEQSALVQEEGEPVGGIAGVGIAAGEVLEGGEAVIGEGERGRHG